MKLNTIKTHYLSLLLVMFITGCQVNDRHDSPFNRYDEKGRKDGVWREYYETGDLQRETNYLGGYKRGEEKRYYRNGELFIHQYWGGDTPYVVLDSVYRHYYKNGKLLQEIHYIEGIPDSILKEYYSNGRIKYKGQYEIGLKVGVWEYYDSTGQLDHTINYINRGQYWTEDDTSGIYTWYDQGAPYYRADYTDGKILRDSIIDTAAYRRIRKK